MQLLRKRVCSQLDWNVYHSLDIELARRSIGQEVASIDFGDFSEHGHPYRLFIGGQIAVRHFSR